MEEIKSHEYADIFPMMDNIDFDNLKKDILENGFDKSRPIIIYEDKILDGRNRFKACKELGIIPSIEKYEGKEPLQFVISTNLNRRHLTDSQRACIAQDVLPLLEVDAKKRMTHVDNTYGKITTGSTSREDASKVMHVSPRYIQEAKKLKQTRPELFEEVKQGKKNLSEIKTLLREEERDNKIKDYKEKTKDIVCENLYQGDCLTEINKIQDNSVACLIIDPPYGIDYQSNYKLAKHDKIIQDTEEVFDLLDKSFTYVSKKLLDDSHIYVFTSWKVYDKIKPIVEKHFEIKNCLIWNKNNWSMGDLQGNYAEKYEMIIFATKGNRPIISDKRPVNVLDFARTTNLNHPTEKPIELLKELIKNSTVEGEIVLDYFAGSGSTLIASKELRRKWIGIELEENYVNVIKGRLR